MTVWELNKRAEGYSREVKREWRQVASLMAAIIQPHSKKTVRPKSLVPFAYDTSVTKMSPERIEKDVAVKMKAYRKHKENG